MWAPEYCLLTWLQSLPAALGFQGRVPMRERRTMTDLIAEGWLFLVAPRGTPQAIMQHDVAVEPRLCGFRDAKTLVCHLKIILVARIQCQVGIVSIVEIA